MPVGRAAVGVKGQGLGEAIAFGSSWVAGGANNAAALFFKPRSGSKIWGHTHSVYKSLGECDTEPRAVVRGQ